MAADLFRVSLKHHISRLDPAWGPRQQLQTLPVLHSGAVPLCCPWSWWSLAPTGLDIYTPGRLTPCWLGTTGQLWELISAGCSRPHWALTSCWSSHQCPDPASRPGGAYRRISFTSELIQSSVSYCDLLCWGLDTPWGCRITKTITATAERPTH